MRKKVYGIIIGAALTVGLFLTGCGTTTINANDYLTISTEGFDTKGTASYALDTEKLLNDNLKAFGLEEGDDMEYLEALGRLEFDLNGKLDKTDSLSNGDEVTFTWKVRRLDELEEKYKVRVEYSDKSVTVEGLDEPEEFDPFDYITVSFSGIAPDGKAVIECDGSIPVKLDFRAESGDHLSNGDTVKVTANAYYGNDLISYCFENGYVPSCEEKEYTVDGLAAYIRILDEIPEDAYKKMDYHAQDLLKATTSSWKYPENFSGAELLGNYLLTPKDSFDYVTNKNYLYYVYKVNCADGFSYYYYTYYTNVMLLEDGSCSFDLSSAQYASGSVIFGITSGEIFSHNDLYYVGYADIDTLFNKHVTSRIGEYKYESTVK